MILCLLCIQQGTFASPIIWRTNTIQRSDESLIYKVKGNGSYEAPIWFGDEKEVLFVLTKGGYQNDYSNIYILNVKTGNITPVTKERNMRITTRDVTLTSKKEIIYAIEEDDQVLLKCLAVEGEVPKRKFVESDLPTLYEDEDMRNPSLSKDGEWLAYDAVTEVELHDGSRVHQIYKRDVVTGEVFALTSDKTTKRRPKWSPDGQLVLYEQYDDQFREWSLYITDMNGRMRRRVTHGLGDELYGSFSPDGQWIVYSTNESYDNHLLENNELHISSVFGDEVIRLTTVNYHDTMPVWSPDGKRVIFQTSPKDPKEYNGSWVAIIDVPEEIEMKEDK